MTVQFGNDHASNINGIRKRRCLVVDRLSLCCIHYQDHIVGSYGSGDFLHLLQQSGFLPVTTRCVDYDNLVVFFHELIDSLFCDCHWIRLRVRTVKRNTKLRGILFELIKRSGTKGIGANHGRLPATLLIVICVLGNGRGFPRSLQPHKQDHVGFAAFHHIRLAGGLQELDQLVDDRFLDHFGDIAGPLLFLGVAVVFVFRVLVVFDETLDLLFDVVPERHDQSDVHIRLDQGPGDLRQDLFELRRRDMTGTRVQLAKGLAEFAAQFGQDHDVRLLFHQSINQASNQAIKQSIKYNDIRK
mmetsp:Transcript_26540/g.72934  ORF Transcript_26540/g.72934 Transcript_26540/m.72934 type:complete len:300 (+) Transcript_26540:3790-4689(+)